MPSGFYLFIKRFYDIGGALLGLFLLTPFLPFIILAIKLNDGGPIFVKLPRVSKGAIFYVYKFRTMIVGAHGIKHQYMHLNNRNDGLFFKMHDDPRITAVGKLLRKIRIDEMPQLINVLEGDLSLVGPRPHEPEEMFYYPMPYRHLLLAKAGVTGLSQVNGASSLPFLKELKLDDEYLRHQSLWLDCKIILKTLRIMFTDPTGV